MSLVDLREQFIHNPQTFLATCSKFARCIDSTSVYFAALEACRKGNLSALQTLYIRFRPSCAPALEEGAILASSGNHVQILQWLKDVSAVKLHAASSRKLVMAACYGGALDVVRLVSNDAAIDVVSIHEPMSMEHNALTAACASGNIALVQYLKGNPRQFRDICFVIACENGHLALAQWLYTSHQSSELMITTDMYAPFRRANKRGQLHVMEWLLATHHHKGCDFVSALFIACEDGRENVVQWLLRVARPHFSSELLKELCEQATVHGYGKIVAVLGDVFLSS